MSRQIQVRSYKKRVKSGKLITVSGYYRRQGNKKSSSVTQAEPDYNKTTPYSKRGDELRAKLKAKTPFTKEELKEYNSRYRYEVSGNNDDYNAQLRQRDHDEAKSSQKDRSNSTSKRQLSEKKKQSGSSFLDKIEKRLDTFTRKYAGKAYKR